MRILAFLSVLCSLSACSSGAGTLDGHWSGTAEHEGRRQRVRLTINTHLKSGFLRIDDERVLRRVSVQTSGSQFSFAISSDDHIEVSGEMVGDEIRMVAVSGPIRVPIQLQRSEAPPPPPYAEEEREFTGGGGFRLSGTVLLPKGRGPHPGIVLIHGSSTPNREDFRFYADAFARCGIAALIFDKRSVVGPDRVARTSLSELAADARAGAELLRTEPSIDPARVGYWGHSQGGWVAPIAAAADARTAFVVSFSGPVASYSEVNRNADMERLRRRGFAREEIHAAGAALDRLDDYVRRGGEADELGRFLHTARQQRWASLISLTNRVPTEEDRRTWLRWRDQDIDTAAYWRQVHAPVLALFGADDDVVPVQLSADRLSAAMRGTGNQDYTLRIFNAGHSIERQPEFMPLMIEWLRRKGGVSANASCL